MSIRIQKLRATLPGHNAPAALIMNPENVGYLTGFSGTTAALIVTEERALFITDSRYAVQAGRECPGFELVITKGSGAYHETISEQAKALALPKLAVEADFLTVAQYEQLAKSLEGVELSGVSDLVGILRRVKDPLEIDRLRAACALADRTFDFVLALLRPGMTSRGKIYAGERLWGQLVLQSLLDLVSLDYRF